MLKPALTALLLITPLMASANPLYNKKEGCVFNEHYYPAGYKLPINIEEIKAKYISKGIVVPNGVVVFAKCGFIVDPNQPSYSSNKQYVWTETWLSYNYQDLKNYSFPDHWEEKP